jgi:hypothetical protein
MQALQVGRCQNIRMHKIALVPLENGFWVVEGAANPMHRDAKTVVAVLVRRGCPQVFKNLLLAFAFGVSKQIILRQCGS